MIYPTINEYISALEEAQDNFDKLSTLRLCTDGGGNPIMSSGNYAVVFKMQDTVTNKYMAVKCFTREQVGREDSYAKIAEELKYEYSNYIVNFEYFDKELFVYSESCVEELFPVVVMDWVNGIPLDSYIRLHIHDQYALNLLTYQFGLLASWLLSQPFAHGDLKPDNILVKQNGDIVLVDYDGMYVPSMKGENAREVGTPGYVHPNHTISDFNEHIDDFSLAVIALSLKAYSIDRAVFRPTESLLFKATDYNCISKIVINKKLNKFLYDTGFCTLYSLFLSVLNNQYIDKSLYGLFRMEIPEKPENTDNQSACSTNDNVSFPYVDLGLSVLWAKFNLGGLSEHDHGHYFTWGEILEDHNFNIRSTEICDVDVLRYYSEMFINIDASSIFDSRMPTIKDFRELITKCKWVETTIEEIAGYTITGPNGNSIFLPISGCRENESVGSINQYAQYLSGNYYNDEEDHYLLLRYKEREKLIYQYSDSLTTGRTIRLVAKAGLSSNNNSVTNETDFVDLGLSVLWSKFNLGAYHEYEHGEYFTWKEIRESNYFKIVSTEKCEILIDNYSKDHTFSKQSYSRSALIPSNENFQELIEKCSWEKKEIQGISGYKVVGPNGNSIFIPISGKKQRDEISSINMYGQYLSSYYKNDGRSYYLLIRYEEGFYKMFNYLDTVSTGRTIRPVIERKHIIPNNIQSSVDTNTSYVDLGLSVKWATCNLGASKPEEEGYFVAWGNTEIKQSFNGSDCCTQGMTRSELVNNGVINSKGQLTPQNDISTIILGKRWRTPTLDEFNELIQNCKWNLVSDSLYKVIGPNGNYILLPLNRYKRGNECSGDSGFYWTSSIGEIEKESYGFYMHKGPHCDSGIERSDGQGIRPVYD